MLKGVRLLSLILSITLLNPWATASAQNAEPPPSTDLVGIGAVVAKKDNQTIIRDILPDSPALKAGLKVNDQIVEVGDQKVDGWKLIEVVDLIRGKAGTAVKIIVRREGQTAPLSFTVTRTPIHLPQGYSGHTDGPPPVPPSH